MTEGSGWRENRPLAVVHWCWGVVGECENGCAPQCLCDYVCVSVCQSCDVSVSSLVVSRGKGLWFSPTPQPEGPGPCWQRSEGRQSSKRALSTSNEPSGPPQRLALPKRVTDISPQWTISSAYKQPKDGVLKNNQSCSLIVYGLHTLLCLWIWHLWFMG